MKAKNLKRFIFISNNALWQVLTSVWNMVIPFMVVHYASKETWGAFVPMLLYTLLAAQVTNWGNKEFLMRRFSFSPNKIKADYSTILFTRLPWVIVFSLGGLFVFPIDYFFPIFLWIAGRYLSQSTEVLVIYEKKFAASLVIELVCFALFISAFFIWQTRLDLALLLLLYSVYQFVRGISFCLLFKGFITLENLKPDLSYYIRAFPFLLLSAFGFFVSKIDVYIVNYFTGEATTADYQVINGLLVFIASASVFIYTPFTKNIYRNDAAVIGKARTLIAISGLAIIPVALIAVRYALLWYLELEFSWPFYLLAFCYIFPSFVYGIRVIELFKRNQEKKVIFFLFLAAAANAIVSVLLLSFGYGILGALSGGVAAQLLALYLFSRH